MIPAPKTPPDLLHPSASAAAVLYWLYLFLRALPLSALLQRQPLQIPASR